MKRVFTERPADSPITVAELEGREVIAYRCLNSDNVNILARLNGGTSWGFISLASSGGKPTYKSESFHDSVKSASSQRKVMVFSDQTELVEAIYKKQF